MLNPQFNRRKLLKYGSASLASFAAVTMIGCPFTPAQAENEINVIIQQAIAIIAVADPGVTWLAAFSKAAAILKADEANWVKGGAVQDVINVLTDLEQVTTLISPLVPYAGLIAVLVAGINTALALLLPAAPTGAVVAHSSRRLAVNPFAGKATVKNGADSKRQWKAIVAANPELAKAAI